MTEALPPPDPRRRPGEGTNPTPVGPRSSAELPNNHTSAACRSPGVRGGCRLPRLPSPPGGAPAARTAGRGSGAAAPRSTEAALAWEKAPGTGRGRPHEPCPPPQPPRRATSTPRPGAGPARAAEGARRTHLGVGRGQAAHVAVAERAVGRAAAAVGAGLGTQRRRSPLGPLHPAGSALPRCAALRPLRRRRRPRPAAPRRTGSATRRFPQSPAETSRSGTGSATRHQRARETGGRAQGEGGGARGTGSSENPACQSDGSEARGRKGLAQSQSRKFGRGWSQKVNVVQSLGSDGSGNEEEEMS